MVSYKKTRPLTLTEMVSVVRRYALHHEDPSWYLRVGNMSDDTIKQIVSTANTEMGAKRKMSEHLKNTAWSFQEENAKRKERKRLLSEEERLSGIDIDMELNQSDVLKKQLA